MKHILTIVFLFTAFAFLHAQAPDRVNTNKFRQLGTDIATPNAYRSASGAPGPMYWQQQADYDMEIILDDTLQRIYGTETITYYNNSPQTLEYLWLQLDQNMRAKESDTYKIATNSIDEETSIWQLERMEQDFDGGFKIDYVRGANDQPLSHTVNKTMMRIDPSSPVKPGGKFVIKIKWWYNINDRMQIGGRSGYEYFEEDDNYLYTIAQFFPRMCVFDDIHGWQNKQFLGRGEFTLPFGNYDVRITVPSDHLVAATGTLANMKEILPKEKRELYEQAMTEYDQPVIIYSQEEAEEREQSKDYSPKTWRFTAENVRDFGFASSRKFIWDAMGVPFGDRNVLAMSMYPKEGNPLWEQYSTKVVAHTLKWYSHYTIEYPYPVAWSINAARIGMEYPMICFNYGRPEKDGTYPERTKYGMIGVIIHEVGHNFFPMIINSDERQWTWMDEGLNTFVQYLTEQQWEQNYPSRRGPAHKIVDYMSGDPNNISPIMTNSESIHQFGNNAYGKPATALNILRETVMGRELFDYAFKTYSERWKFKHPSPADFFRTMEDASAVDLDWFWRGWFFSTENVDIAISDVEAYVLKDPNPQDISVEEKAKRAKQNQYISKMRDDRLHPTRYADEDPSLNDFYNTYDPLDVDKENVEEYNRFMDRLSEEQKQMLQESKFYYQLTFENKGGLVMPIILQFTFTDGSEEVIHIPAEIWRKRNEKVTKVFPFEKEIQQIILDPYYETADVDRSNNYYPQQSEPTRFDLYRERNNRRENPMQRAKRLAD
jgi:hypothetical protein